MQFHPVGDRVLVKPDTQETVTASGIVLVPAKGSQELPGSGVIIALGEGKTYPDCPNPKDFFKKGDRIYYNRYAAEDLEIEKEEYAILRLDAIFGYAERKRQGRNT